MSVSTKRRVIPSWTDIFRENEGKCPAASWMYMGAATVLENCAYLWKNHGYAPVIISHVTMA